MFIVFLTGFSSGLPLLLLGSTMKAWFTDSGMDLTTIGFFSLVGLPYTFKFLWAPFLDKVVPPFLGRRRGWMIITQIGLAAGFVFLSTLNPADHISLVAAVAVTIAVLSATQDIALDAYRREILETEELGLGNSMFITSYRFGMMFAGAFALFLADQAGWGVTYLTMGVAFGIGIIATILAPEPKIHGAPPKTLAESFVAPLSEYFRRDGAILILVFILLYKVGDAMATEMTMPFYLKSGYSKTEVAAVAKVFGIWATIAGGLIGGAVILKIGLRLSLWAFGFLQALSTFGFAWLATLGAPNVTALTGVITFENLSSGMGTAAFVAFMASLTNKRYTATQYALLSSLMGVPRVIIAAPTGWMVERMGWVEFFVFCGLIAIPGLLMLFKVGKWANLGHGGPSDDPEEKNGHSVSRVAKA